MRKGSKHTEETKKKVSLAKKGKPSNRKGVKLSKFTINKIKIARANQKIEPHLGHKHSEETKKAHSIYMKKWYAVNPSKSLGQKRSLATREKLSKSHKGYKMPISQRENISNALKGKPREWQKKPEYLDKLHKLWVVSSRKKGTSIERKIESQLTQNQINFKRQIPIKNCVPDILIDSENNLYKGLAIFADGCYWHGCSECNIPNKNNELIRIKDFKITNMLFNEGYYVMRLKEHEIKKVSFDVIPYINEVIGVQ